MDYPQVALDFMNHDHAEFAALREQLLEKLAAPTTTGKKDSSEIASLLDQLLQHTRHHFANEEAQMQACGFPAYPIHKVNHDQVIAELVRQITYWQQQHDLTTLQEFIRVAVAEWFVTHVSTMDKMTAQFIAAHR